MEKINQRFLSHGVSTHIREGFNGWQAGFSIGNQTFYLQPVSCDKGDDEDTKQKAMWYQDNLEEALLILTKKVC